ncbi:MAG: branched-chain amino acid ABC transporter permease [Anaerolineales bacterium]|nr:branched-chain amino acid ABC transporter permease [Anaerolineales bacterium]MDW8161576.1 branched-chain amino acid ABC transporter permease [Anaerolineales bacterium]
MRIDRHTLGFWVVLLGLIILVQVLVSLGILSPFWETLLKIGAVMAIVSLGLNLIYGFNGQFSLGQWGFYAIGAYAAADVTYRWTQMNNASGLTVLFAAVALVGVAFFLTAKLVARLRGIDPLSAFALYIVATLIAAVIGVQIGIALIAPVTQLLATLPPGLALQIVYLIAVLLGGCLAAEVSYLFGLPVLTLGSDYFGIATLGFTIIVKVLLDNSDTLLGFEEMKGARGMVGIPKTTSWFWVALFLVIVIVLLRNLLHSSHGRAIVSVREDEIAAKAMGIDVGQQKTLAFVLGSLFAGLAGGLYAHINGFLHPNTFNFIRSFDPMIIVVFGGLGSVSGTIIAAFTWALVLEGFLRILLPTGFETWRFVVYPLFLLVMMLLRPQGLFGGFEFPYLRPVLPRPYVPETEEQVALVHAVEEATEGD